MAIPLLFVHLWWVVTLLGRQPKSAHRLRVPMVVKTAGNVGCHSRCWYWFAVELPFGNPGPVLTHSMNCANQPAIINRIRTICKVALLTMGANFESSL
jgi:hypothetical protein